MKPERQTSTGSALEHSLKINRSNLYFDFILSSPQRNKISTFPKKIYIFEFLGVTNEHKGKKNSRKNLTVTNAL
jgi:hypothetical protein